MSRAQCEIPWFFLVFFFFWVFFFHCLFLVEILSKELVFCFKEKKNTSTSRVTNGDRCLTGCHGGLRAGGGPCDSARSFPSERGGSDSTPARGCQAGLQAASSRTLPSLKTRQRGKSGFVFGSVQSLSRVRLFATPWTAARQASLSIPDSRG